MSNSIAPTSSLNYSMVPSADDERAELELSQRLNPCSKAIVRSRGINSFRDTNQEHAAMVLALQPSSSNALRQWQIQNADQIMEVGRQQAVNQITDCRVSEQMGPNNNPGNMASWYSLEESTSNNRTQAHHNTSMNQCVSQNG